MDQGGDTEGIDWMMGERTVMQEALLYEFSIDRYVPAGHVLLSGAPHTAMRYRPD